MADGQADSAAPAAGGGGNTKTPSDFLKSIKGKPVVVKLNSGVDYRGASAAGRVCARALGSTMSRPVHRVIFTWAGRFTVHSSAAAGILACLDGYMNIAMEQTEVSL
jgi:small nuclear ribonucleoprotein (snRNP)-like protein